MTTMQPIDGIIPVMLTPYRADNTLDMDGYERLTHWYLDHGSDALFAVCQSSEMFYLSLDERVALARRTVQIASERATDRHVPVLASGHVGHTREEQLEELLAMADTGIDALVLVTNRFPVAQEASDAEIRDALDWLMERLPADLPLGLYECPMPYRRLLSDDMIRFCADSGRFVTLKDVSCDLDIVTRRLAIVDGSPLAIVNANAAIAWPAMQAGSTGFCGVLNNFHPDLYAWLLNHGSKHPELADELAVFLALAGMIETQGYPAVAKRYHQRIGTFDSLHCRNVDDGWLERHWAVDALIDNVTDGAAVFRERIGRLAGG